MPSADLDSSIDNRMLHSNSKCSYQLCSSEQVAKVPRANSKAAPSHFPKIRLFIQLLFGTYIRFDKGPEQAHSVLYAFGHRDRRQVARLFKRNLRFCDIAPKVL